MLEDTATVDAPVAEEAPEAEVQQYSKGSITIPWSTEEATPEQQPTESGEQETETAETPVQEAPSDAEPQAESAAPKRDPFEGLNDDEIADLVKSDPRLKRRLDGEVGSRLQREREAIVAKAQREAVAQARLEDRQFNAAVARLNELEQLEVDDPVKYDEFKNAPEYLEWKTKVIRWANAREAEQSAPPQEESFDPKAFQSEFATAFNTAGITQFQAEVKQGLPWFNEMPPAQQRAIMDAAYAPGDGSWVRKGIAAFVQGTKTYWDQKLKEATEQARLAGRNEALAEAGQDAPVSVAAPKSGRKRDTMEIIAAYGMGDKSVSLAEYQAATRARGW